MSSWPEARAPSTPRAWARSCSFRCRKAPRRCAGRGERDACAPSSPSRSRTRPETPACGSASSICAVEASPLRAGLVLREHELDRGGRRCIGRVVRLDERAYDRERRLAAEPCPASVALAPEAWLAVHDPRAREVEPREIVPRLEQRVGHEELHRAQVLYAVHVAIGVGLP